MSASEKLKALIDAPVEGQAEYLRLANVLADALPQIVAVVEAAEKVASGELQNFNPLRAALSVLDEALS